MSLHSASLANLASAAQNDEGLGKVADMIRNLIQKLKQQHSKEQKHAAYCDVELSKNTQNRESNTLALNSASANVNELTATIQTLNEEIADLSKRQATLEEDKSQADTIRAEQKTDNAKNIKENSEAATAIRGALEYLRSAAFGHKKSLQLEQST